ncbi:hypothetical protein ACFXJ8_13915 [Nonomuraea sp. NPDC059194]|uniref:hypothetical protein n=1 Tax=Nonomuraea sp. NPDC059194 TaxID=3346764 RepID=UPI0036B9E149
MRDAVIVQAVRSPIGRGKPGGALAHVHPVELLAHTLRARIMTTLVHAMRQRGSRYALQTMCEAGGLANATILERIQ